MNLFDRLKNQEDNFVERKPGNVNAAQIRKTLVGFANSVVEPNVGILFIGVHDNGIVLGVENPDKMQKTVGEQCEKVCYPPIGFSTEVIEIDSKTVVAVQIRESKNRPHFSGPAYVRQGSRTVSASEHMLCELIESRSSKVAKILLMKKSGPITVVSKHHVLGKDKFIPDQKFVETNECTIQSCDSHTVKLQILGSGRNVTEPLEAVTISYDEAKHRPKLIVRALDSS